jgi:hypothetical protein
MATNTMDPATAVTWGPFIQAAYEQYVSNPGEVNPSSIKNMPAGYTLMRTIQMTDFFGPVQTRVFYGFVAVGGAPKTAVVALRGSPPRSPTRSPTVSPPILNLACRWWCAATAWAARSRRSWSRT